MAIYKVSGNTQYPSRVILIDETSGNIIDSMESDGSFEFNNLGDDNNKIVLCRRLSDGESSGYSRVTPVNIIADYPYLDKFDLDSYTQVYWLDANNGSDANDGLSMENACQTWLGMYDKMPTDCTDIACILMPGKYWGEQTADVNTAVLFKARAHASYIASAPGEVILENAPPGKTAGRDASFFGGGSTIASGKTTTLYGMVYEHYVGSRIAASLYTVAFHRWAGLTHYNCAMTYSSRTGNHISSLMYNNDLTTAAYMYNCTFWQGSWAACYTNGGNMYVYDSMSPNSLVCGTRTNTVQTATMSNHVYNGVKPYFWSTSHDNYTYGIYSGTYAWPL